MTMCTLEALRRWRIDNGRNPENGSRKLPRENRVEVDHQLTEDKVTLICALKIAIHAGSPAMRPKYAKILAELEAMA